MRNPSRLLSVLLLTAAGCTYNPVRYDPATGFQHGGGVGVLCGGPLDPWMLHCCPQCGASGSCACRTLNCLGSCLEKHFCCHDSACPTPAPVCPTPAPICPTPVCPPAGVPLGSPYTPLPTIPSSTPIMQAPIAPISSPHVIGAPTPTFTQPCPTCGPTPSAGISGYPQTVEMPYPGVSNYPQLFQAPPMAPPAQPQSGDHFMMPTPLNQGEIVPSPGPMPPHYDNMEPPAPEPAPAPMTPMPMQNAQPMNNTPMPMNNAQPMNNMPMQNAAPMNPQTPAAQPMPMPMNPQTPAAEPTGANHQMGLPRITPASMIQPENAQPGVHYDSRRQQWIPLRL